MQLYLATDDRDVASQEPDDAVNQEYVESVLLEVCMASSTIIALKSQSFKSPFAHTRRIEFDVAAHAADVVVGVSSACH